MKQDNAAETMNLKIYMDFNASNCHLTSSGSLSQNQCLKNFAYLMKIFSYIKRSGKIFKKGEGIYKKSLTIQCKGRGKMRR